MGRHATTGERPTSSRPASSRRGASLLAVGAAALVVATLATALAWRADGGRWFVVRTPSMGTALPVGSLVVTTPVAVSDVVADDVVTFHSPRSRTVYTHRVVATTGTHLTTQGDVNDAPDTGTIDQADLVGRVVWHAPALGRAVQAVPLLAVGGALTWLVSLALEARRRREVRLVGLSLTASVTNYLLDPWVGIERMSERPPDDGSPVLLLDVVSVGLLPVRAEQVGGGPASTLGSGEVATLALAPRSNGAYDVVSSLHLPWWGWVLLALTCLTPMLVSLVLSLVLDEPPPVPEDHPATGRHLAPHAPTAVPA